MWASGICRYFILQNLQKNAAFVLSCLKRYYWPLVAGYIFFYLLFAVSALPAVSYMSILGGYVFGYVAFIYILIAATLSSTIIFSMGRYLFGDFFQKKYEKKLITFNKLLHAKGFWILILLRNVPIIPFFVLNTLVALTAISISTFIIATFFGMMPISFLLVYTGYQLQSVHTIADIFNGQLIAGIVMFLLLLLLPIILHKRLKIFWNQ